MEKESKISRDNVIKKLPTLEVRQKDLIYFKNKMLDYEAEQQKFKEKLEKYKKIAEDRHMLEAELLNKRNKICALQNALSEMQKCLFDERERSNKLQGEVDLLRVQEEEFHQKLRSLLAMTGDKKLRSDIIYTFEKPLGLQIRQRMLNTLDEGEKQTEVKQVDFSESQTDPLEIVDTLQRQNEAIQGLMQQQTTLDREKIEAMVKNCSITMKEAEKQSKEYSKRMQELAEKLKETESDLIETNTELLETKKVLHREEILRGIQKSVLLKNIEDAIGSMSANDTINTVVDKVISQINKAFEKFEMINDEKESTDDLPENNVLPKKVSSNVKFSDKILKNTANIPNEKVSSTVEHNHSTGKFIHYRNSNNPPRYESRNKIPTKPTSLRQYLSKNNGKGKTLSRVASAPVHHSPFRRNSLRTSKSTSKVTKKNVSSQTFPARPKTADPRRRRKAVDENCVILDPKAMGDTSFPEPCPPNMYIEKDKETDPTAKDHTNDDDEFVIPAGLSYNEILQYVRSKIGGKRPSSVRTDRKTFHHNKQSQSATNDVPKKETAIPKTQGGVFDSHLYQLPDFYKQTSIKPVQNPVFTQQTILKKPDVPDVKHLISDSHKTCEEKIKDLQDVILFLNTELKEIHNQCADYERTSQECVNNYAEIQRALNDCKNKEGPNKLLQYQEWLEKELKEAKYKLKKLESYRRLEIEGLLTQLNNLSKKVQEMQNQALKIFVLVGKGKKDMEVLKDIHSATMNSAQVSSEVQRLKTKLFQIQNDMRFL